MNNDDRRASWLFAMMFVIVASSYVYLNWDAVVPELTKIVQELLK